MMDSLSPVRSQKAYRSIVSSIIRLIAKGELFELRQALQIEAVGHAAERADDGQLEALEQLNTRLEALLGDDPPDPILFAQIDYEFHREIARQLSLHDPAEARRVMRQHLERPYQTMTDQPIAPSFTGLL